MIYKIKAEGYPYPIHVNTAVIPIMYIIKIEKNLYELTIVESLSKRYKLTINALENRDFIEFMGGKVEE
jgi:hypothetical protein